MDADRTVISPIDHALAVLRRRRVLAAVTAVVVGALALVVGLSTTPLYEAEAKLVVDRDRKAVTLASSNEREGASDDAYSILTTHVQLLTAPQVLTAAMEATKLAEQAPYSQALVPVDVLEKRLRVSPLRDSWIIELNLRDEDPERARRVLAAVIDAYLASEARRRSELVEGSLGGLRGQVQRARIALEAARAREQALRREKGVVGLDPDANHLTAELSNLNLTRVRLAGEIAAADALAAAVIAAKDEQALLQIPEIRREQLVALALQAVSENAEKRAALGEIFKDKHPKMIEADAALAASRTRLNEAISATRMGLEDGGRSVHRQATEIDQRIAVLEKDIAAYRDTLASLKARTNETATAERLHEQLLNRLNEEEVNGQLNAPRVSIAQPPRAGSKPVNIRLSMFLMGAIAAGVGSGIGIAFVAELLERRVRSPRTMPELAGLPLLSELPAAPGLPIVGPQPSSRSADPRLAGFDDGIRLLRTAWQLAMPAGAPPGVVCVASPQRGDGRTTVAARLAASLAASGRRVLLVDGDLPRPGIPRQLAISGSEPGLSDLLGGTTLDVGPLSTGHPSLDVVTAGTPVENTAELLHGARLSELVAAWRGAYEAVVIDAPPLDHAEALELADAADHVLLVVREAHTSKAALTTSLERLARVRGRLTGVVANG